MSGLSSRARTGPACWLPSRFSLHSPDFSWPSAASLQPAALEMRRKAFGTKSPGASGGLWPLLELVVWAWPQREGGGHPGLQTSSPVRERPDLCARRHVDSVSSSPCSQLTMCPLRLLSVSSHTQSLSSTCRTWDSWFYTERAGKRRNIHTQA